jgi:hypothetical protein
MAASSRRVGRFGIVVVAAAAGIVAVGGASTADLARDRGCTAIWRLSKGAKTPWGSVLVSVAGGPSSVWAVGRQRWDGSSGSAETPAGSSLIEHWDGNRWTIARSPNAGKRSGLLGVKAFGHEAWAVGFRGRKPLIEHWDGKRWMLVSGAVAGDGALYAVAGTNARNVWAVGVGGSSYGEAEYTQRGRPLILHWDGRSWRALSVPSYQRQFLKAVAIVGPHDAWAVGGFGYGIVVHWSGALWALVPFSVPENSYGGALEAVAGTPGGGVWVAGYPGIAHWDGVRWRFAVVVPRVTSREQVTAEFLGLEVESATQAWVVGDRYSDSGLGGPLIERWDGKRWRNERLPPQDGAVRSVASVGAREAWAVGLIYDKPTGPNPVIWHWACR